MKRCTTSAMSLLLGLFVTCAIGENARAQGDGLGLISDPNGRVIVNQSAVFEQSGNGHTNVPFGPRVRSYSQFGNGFGWEDGHTFANVFYPLHLNPGVDLIFVDLRGFVTYNDIGEQSGGNVGIGYRRFYDSINTMVGISAWGDADGGHQQNFFQAGASVEVIYNNLEMRVNGYLAEGDGSKRVFANQIVGGPVFANHRILVNRQSVTDVQYDGVDGEIGGLLPGLSLIQAHGYVGGYYMHSDDFGDFAGVKVRGEVYMHEDIQAGVEFRKDPKFGESFWVNAMVQLPNEPFRKWWSRLFQPRGKSQQLSRQVERNYRIPVKREVQNTRVLLINPADGQPYFVFHVDPNARGTGGPLGSFENPFRTLEAARMANGGMVDIIRVVGGSNLTTPNGALAVNGPFMLFEGQRLLSSTVNHTIGSQLGTFTLPGFTGGASPLLNNGSTTAGSVIQLVGDRTEVSGFVIDGTDSTGNVRHAGILNTPGISGFDINRNSFQNAVSGINLVQATGTGNLSDNDVQGMATHGFRVANSSGTTALTVENNTINGSNGDGFIIQADGTATFNATGILNNDFSNNNGASFAVRGNGVPTGMAGVHLGLVSGNNFNRDMTGTHGLFVDTTEVNFTAMVQRNTFNGSTANPSVGRGLSVDMTGGNLNLQVGGPNGADGNTFDMNAGVGIGIVMRGNANGTFQIQNNVVTRTANDNMPLSGFAGEGIGVRLNGDPMLPLSTVVVTNTLIANNTVGDLNNPALANASHGIFVNATENNHIQHMSIVENTSANNLGNGIFFLRQDNSHLNDIQILRNNTSFNLLNGMLLSAQNANNDASDYLVRSNQINGNLLSGVELSVSADAALQANLDNNTITGNGLHGVSLTEVVNAATDLREVAGVWTKNNISNNAGNGINAGASMTSLVVGMNGLDPNDGRPLGNIISGNGLAGVLITGSGTATFSGNLIAMNGAALGNVHEGAGVDIEGVGFKTLTFDNNSIRSNFGDGFEFNNNNQGLGFPFIVSATGNAIENNLGRGVDILNQGDADSTLTFRNNSITGNQHEGFYVVNTSSFTQQQNAPSTAALAADGLTDRAPFLTLVIENNNISQNGAASLFSATGLVVRVGTSQFGSVSAQVNNNTMQGNFGDDVYFESFTSTVAPAAAVADPLAVVFLQFTGNTGDSLDVVNFGAFYNNADAGKSPNPPFTQGNARPRNAQRFPGAFPGLGTSTFIVEAMGGMDPAGTLGNNFTNFDGFTSAVLLPNSGPGGTFTTFTWDLVPVGSLFP